MAVLPALECDERFASFLEAGGAAHIENAFEHAVNLGWNGEIFSIVAKDGYRAPHTATVPPRVSFASVASHVGRPTRTEGTSLVLSPECRIDFSRCARFSCRTAPIPTQTSRDEALIAFDAAIALLPARGGCIDGYRNRALGMRFELDTIDRAVDERVSRFLDNVRLGRSDAPGLIVGAGRGLTPSGDDFLCGFMAMLGASAPERAAHSMLVRSLSELDLLRKTTAVSRQMIIDSCSRRHPSPHLRLIEAFSHHGRGMADALRELYDIGHTSGLDFAAGAASAARLFSATRA